MNISEQYRELPVSEIAVEVNASLGRVPRLVVTAPPGAGKSTLLPLSILESLPEGKILMLEPRRLAARQVAARMASMLGEKPGQTVGYRVRFDTKVSAGTRIEVITEGIMERLLVKDPTLEGVGAVIFDEFHERSLSSDLSLALVRETATVLRPELKIVIMSATIDAAELCRKLDAPHISSEGRMFGVDLVYGEDYEARDCASAVASAVRRAHREQPGDILAFLPGQAEIIKCAELLKDALGNTVVLPLYGLLPPEQQRAVLSQDRDGRRRVVLATSIAETSLTIEGITTVVDSGLCRKMVFDPQSGLSRLCTAGISKDMATQRAGRAGRLCRGVCYRLWSKAAGHRMSDCREPEIIGADLAPLVLETAAWGESNPLSLQWITPPPPGHVAHASELLRSLGAVDSEGRITATGKKLSELPCHPRISRMLTEAANPSLACDIAALLEEKDPLNDENDADLTTRIALLRQYRVGRLPCRWQRIADVAAQYRRLVGCREDNSPLAPGAPGRLIALAYPERIAQNCGDGRFRLASGEFVRLNESDDLSGQTLLAVANMGARIFLAAPLDHADAAKAGTWRDNVGWDNRNNRAVARCELRVGALILDTRPSSGDTRALVLEAICAAAPSAGLTMFDFNTEVRDLQQRLATVADWHPELNLPPTDTEAILSSAREWLPMYIGKATSAQELRKIDMCAVIMGIVGFDNQQIVDRLAPSHITLPSGRKANIEYRRAAEAPVVRARLQDCFGMRETPRLDDGRRTVLMELLSPGFKPVQLTQDMAGFWTGSYHEIRKELRRRYPKHPWPENP